MKKFTYVCYFPVTTVTEVMDHMRLLNEELKGTHLKNLIPFNHTYYIITHNVFRNIGTNFFQKDHLMLNTDVTFAMYYFTALKNYIDKKSCPPAWRLLFEACQRNNTYQFIYMALGVNAHVNNDLPQTLQDVMGKTLFKNDYDRINNIIHASIPEVVLSLNETNLLIHFGVHQFHKLYGLVLNQLIKNWRNHAWKNYIILNKNIDAITQIESEAERIAYELANITKIHTIPLVLRTFHT